MTVRYRKFEQVDLYSCRTVEVTAERVDKSTDKRIEKPRRIAVLDFLATLEPDQIYGIVEESGMGCPIATLVYYREKVNGTDVPQQPSS